MKIAIIGGGFSALSLSLQIISKGSAPLSLYICEQRQDIGLGTAYSTEHPWHLLNVRAAQMGAASDDPEGFFRWLQNNETSWRLADPAFKELSIEKEAFLPRKLYAIYLSELLNEIKTTSLRKNIHFEIIKNNALDIIKTPENELRVVFSDNQSLNVDQVVLAVGVQPIKDLPFAIPSSKYVGNLWKLEKQHFMRHISGSTKDSAMLIIGTGLTMVDMVTSLDKLGYPGKIIALSRHGQLPAVHPERQLPALGNLNNILAPESLLDKIHAFRKELEEIRTAGGHWVQLFETLRPATVKLWNQLSIQDKKRFLRHCLPLWNKHRHRMPIDSMRLIDKLLQERRLKILSGKIIDIHDNNILEIRYKHDNTIESLQADYIYNCTGPDYTLHRSSEPLIQNLMNRGWITPDSLGLGIKCDSNFHAEGPFSDYIYVMGAFLFGENFETTAAPDIRNHAQTIASQILHYTQSS